MSKTGTIDYAVLYMNIVINCISEYARAVQRNANPVKPSVIVW